MNPAAPPLKNRKETLVLIISVFIAGLCSIVYELLIGTASSYFLGDSVRQFSLTIGLYMAAMGIGSYASRLIRKHLLSSFIGVEILLGFLGGISIPILYVCYAYTSSYTFFMVILILLIGILIGLEIPLLTRLMERYYSLKINISNVLSVDYLGALIATLLFPFVFLPLMGTFRSSLFFGLINMGIGYLNLWCFREELKISHRKFYYLLSTGICLFLGLMLFFSQFMLKQWNSSLYQDRVIFTRQSPYQEIVLTKYKADIRMFINGNLQFSSIDEYRYHEVLVHIPFSTALRRDRVLLLGGGDGLAVREMLKYTDLGEIDLVDLDPEIIRIASENPHLKALNRNSLKNRKVKIINTDAFRFLEESARRYDIIIADLPDPNNSSLARLYSREFYRLIRRHLSKGGVFLSQATSPYFAPQAFWCIRRSMAAAGLRTLPCHVYVPSFGDWGFVLGSEFSMEKEDIRISVPTGYLTEDILPGLFVFPPDMREENPEISTLDQPNILEYYRQGWKYWN